VGTCQGTIEKVFPLTGGSWEPWDPGGGRWGQSAEDEPECNCKSSTFVLFSVERVKHAIFSLPVSSLKFHGEVSCCLASCGLEIQQVCLPIVSIYLNWYLIKVFEEENLLPERRLWEPEWRPPVVPELLSGSQLYPWYIPFLHNCTSSPWWSTQDPLFCKQLLGGNLTVVFTPLWSQEFQNLSGKHCCVSSSQFEQTKCGWGENLVLPTFI